MAEAAAGRPAPAPDLQVGAGVAGVPGGPRHVAIIMDGNGRWARRRKLPRIAGHRAGVEAVRRVVRAAPGLGITTLTLYAFSSENWRRPADEVSDLMGLLLTYVRSEIDELDEAGVRLNYIGDWRSLAPDIVLELERARDRTSANNGLNLVVALNYGGQQEILRAMRRLAEEVASGRITAEEVTVERLEEQLDTAGVAPVDLIIRTSGEIRLSNFLLWQSAYSELWFTPVLWPDFDEAVLREAVQSFALRERRFGGL
jgi:undecaprenyl diphosphate synthase